MSYQITYICGQFGNMSRLALQTWGLRAPFCNKYSFRRLAKIEPQTSRCHITIYTSSTKDYNFQNINNALARFICTLVSLNSFSQFIFLWEEFLKALGIYFQVFLQEYAENDSGDRRVFLQESVDRRNGDRRSAVVGIAINPSWNAWESHGFAFVFHGDFEGIGIGVSKEIGILTNRTDCVNHMLGWKCNNKMEDSLLRSLNIRSLANKLFSS